jgi:hypothetical protein
LSAVQVAGSNRTKTLLQVRQPAPHSCHPTKVDDHHLMRAFHSARLKTGNLSVHLTKDHPIKLTNEHHPQLHSDTAL